MTSRYTTSRGSATAGLGGQPPLRRSSRRCAATAARSRAATRSRPSRCSSGAEPRNARSGGSSASTIARTAAAEAVGSPGVPMRFLRASTVCACSSAYAGSSSERFDEEPPQSVEKPPGSIRVTWMPKPATSCGQRLREALERPLRRVVGADQRERRDAADRRHLQDVAGALLAQERQRRLRHPHRAEDVGLHLVAELLLGQLLDEAEVAVAGVVDDDVEPAEVRVRLLRRPRSRPPGRSRRAGAAAARRRTSRTRSSRVLVSRAVAATRSPRSSAAIVHSRPKPRDAPVMNQVFEEAVMPSNVRPGVHSRAARVSSATHST